MGTKYVHHIYIISTKTYFSLIKVQYIIAYTLVCLYINIYMCMHSPIQVCMHNVPTYLCTFCTHEHNSPHTMYLQTLLAACLQFSPCEASARAVSVVGAVREGGADVALAPMAPAPAHATPSSNDSSVRFFGILSAAAAAVRCFVFHPVCVCVCV